MNLLYDLELSVPGMAYVRCGSLFLFPLKAALALSSRPFFVVTRGSATRLSLFIALCGYFTASFQWGFVYQLIIMMRVSSYWQHVLFLAKLSLLAVICNYVGSYPISLHRSTQLQNFKLYHSYHCPCVGVQDIVRSVVSVASVVSVVSVLGGDVSRPPSMRFSCLKTRRKLQFILLVPCLLLHLDGRKISSILYFLNPYLISGKIMMSSIHFCHDCTPLVSRHIVNLPGSSVIPPYFMSQSIRILIPRELIWDISQMFSFSWIMQSIASILLICFISSNQNTTSRMPTERWHLGPTSNAIPLCCLQLKTQCTELGG